MSDLIDRFERLANRGSMRGGDAVLRAARVEVDGAVVRSIDAPGVARVDDAVEPIELQPSRMTKRPRRRFGAAVAASGVAASLVIGTLAIGSLVGNGGGSDSPAGAVRQLADAVSHEDPIAAAAVLAPEEVRSLDSTVNAAEQRAQTLALARRADAPLQGIDFSVDGLDLSTESLGSDFAKVTIAGGRFSAQSHTGELAPLVQQALRDGPDGSTEANLATLEQSNDLPTFVMTVRHEGHWYVSAAYTLLEYIRELNHLPAADFGSGVRDAATLGADSPGAAVTNALQDLSTGDWASLIALSPPDELPVYDYRAALEQLGSQSSYGGFTIDHADPTVTVDGDTAKVLLDAAGHNHNGDPWALNGACWEPPVPADEIDPIVGASSLCDGRAFSIIPLIANEPGNAATARFTVVREDGRWFVSGVGTALDLLDNAIRTISERTVYSLMLLPQRIPPDGPLRLGVPVTPAIDVYGYHVYTFAGRKGEQLLSLTTPTGPRSQDEGDFTDLRMFDASGREVDGAEAMDQGQPLTLPADGTYLIAVQVAVPARFAIYDAADAPDAAKHPPSPAAVSTCDKPMVAGVCEKQVTATTSTVP